MKREKTMLRFVPITLTAAVLLARFLSFGQVETAGSRSSVAQSQPFFIDGLCFAQYDSLTIRTRLDVYIKIPYSIIQFTKDDEGFSASYSVTVILSDEQGGRIREESWDRILRQPSFDATVAPSLYDITYRSFIIPPGEIILEVLFEDGESKKEYRRSKAISAKKFDPNLLAMSDLMLVNRAMENEGKKIITPQVSSNVASLGEEFSVFFEVYNPFTERQIRIRYAVRSARNTSVFEKSELQPLSPGRNTFITRLKTEDFDIGSYQLAVEFYHSDDTASQRLLATSTLSFKMEWLSAGTPITINDLDLAIEQLRYFARDDDLDYIREAVDPKEKRRRFEDFWERQNPVPGALPNLRMVEYYNRIAYANVHFKHFIDGWKTDRGMVYVINGPPTAVERHPLDVESKPYEIWEYTDLNMRYIFVDESGFGDYRLLYPMWDDRNRIR